MKRKHRIMQRLAANYVLTATGATSSFVIYVLIVGGPPS